ncbi:MAG: LytTR family DNA-binding domain-containing protein [Cyclobacteriaceae bacterium]
MSKYRCIAIDDDLVALKIMLSLVNRIDFLDMVATFDDSVKGASAIVELSPDIVFLDVQMPDMSGIDILKNLEKQPQIIMITSQSDFALDAFDFNVTDYLVKPISDFGRFLKAVNRAVDNLKKPTGLGDDQDLYVKSDSLLVKLNLNNIQYLEAYGDYVKVHTPEKVHVVYSKLKDAEAKLPTNDFIRVHRSFIVRLSAIKNIDQGNLQIADKIIPISASNRKTLLERISTL